MDRRAIVKNLVATGCLFLLISACAATNSPAQTYSNGPQTALRIGNDLYQTLDGRYRENVNPQWVQIETSDSPVITPIESSDDNRAPHSVLVSMGYIDLINHIAHAKAIDHIQHGFFQQYVRNLACQTGGGAPPNMSDPRYWKEDVMNEQMGLFNQMMGMTLAISLSHHYLGHYNKYANQMLDGKRTPINCLIDPAEWEASIRAATVNSLDCAYGTEGAIALFDAINMMGARPAWTAFILPAAANVKKLDKTLARYEADYFHGGITAR
jgi:hypothetical protein